MGERGRTLNGKVAVVTGGAGGIGAALCRKLNERGADVALLDMNIEAAEALAAELTGRGRGRARAWRCDVSDEAAWAGLMREIIGNFGGLDLLVNNAGISQHSLVQNTPTSALRRLMDVNFYGAVYGTMAALPHLKASRGMVVGMSSVAGFAPLVGRSAYCASKHAMHGWFDTLRTEVEGDGVDVLLVCPSFVATDIDKNALNSSGVGKPVMGKLTSPQEIAERVIAAVEGRKRLLAPSLTSQAALWVSRVAPSVYDRMMLRKQGDAYLP